MEHLLLDRKIFVRSRLFRVTELYARFRDLFQIICTYAQPIAVEAASYAVLLDAIIHPTVNIRREPEGHESNSFKAIFEHTVTSENLFEGLMAAHKDPSESKNGPKLLWIGGKDEIRLEEVEYSYALHICTTFFAR